jgi:hypothetical protein
MIFLPEIEYPSLGGEFSDLLIRKKCGIIRYQNLVLENPHEN